MITSAEEFVRLRSSEIKLEYLQAAHDSADVQVWLEVIEKYPDFQEWVAHNKSIPNEIIELLSESQNARVRSTIADKRKTPVHILEKLSRDTDESVRLRVAYNAKVSKEILVSLLDDSWERVVETAREKLSQRNLMP
jgi:translation initiation factor RLI1